MVSGGWGRWYMLPPPQSFSHPCHGLMVGMLAVSVLIITFFSLHKNIVKKLESKLATYWSCIYHKIEEQTLWHPVTDGNIPQLGIIPHSMGTFTWILAQFPGNWGYIWRGTSQQGNSHIKSFPSPHPPSFSVPANTEFDLLRDLKSWVTEVVR
jgi:hypothetical protein